MSVERLAATKAKAARKIAAPHIAAVWAYIAERKRKREEQEAIETHGERQATKERRQDNPGEMQQQKQNTNEGAQRREHDNSAEQATQPRQRTETAQAGKGACKYVCPFCAKPVTSKLRTGRIDHRRTCGNRFRVKDGRVVAKGCVYTCPELEATSKQKREKDRTQVPAEGRAETTTPMEPRSDARTREEFRAAGHAKKKLWEYICPSCGEAVTSNVRTGQVNHRRRCGNQFSVRDGRAVAKSYVYVCPFCNGNVLSNTPTGQINHRTVCNNQFYVKDGHVLKTTRQHPHSCPVCHRIVWSSRSCGVIDIRHTTPAGKLCKKRKWHVRKNCVPGDSKGKRRVLKASKRKG